MTLLLCTFLGLLAEAILFTLFLHLCLGLKDFVRWGVSLVRKCPHRSSRGERLAKKTTRGIVETLEKKVCHKEKNAFSTVATERSAREPHGEPATRLFAFLYSFCSFLSFYMLGSTTSNLVSIMGSTFANLLSSEAKPPEAEPLRGSASHPMRAKYFP